MAKLKAFAVHDEKAGAFLRPYFSGTRGMAIRAFSDAVNDPKHEFGIHTADYTLFEIGEYDELSGSLTSAVVSLGNALQFRVMGDGSQLRMLG